MEKFRILLDGRPRDAASYLLELCRGWSSAVFVRGHADEFNGSVQGSGCRRAFKPNGDSAACFAVGILVSTQIRVRSSRRDRSCGDQRGHAVVLLSVHSSGSGPLRIVEIVLTPSLWYAHGVADDRRAWIRCIRLIQALGVDAQRLSGGKQPHVLQIWIPRVRAATPASPAAGS